MYIPIYHVDNNVANIITDHTDPNESRLLDHELRAISCDADVITYMECLMLKI